MNQLHMWQIAVDVALVVTILIMSAKALKSKAMADSGRFLELERGIRDLLAEADRASRGLSDTLRERQRSLETLLKDLRESEERLSDQSNRVDERVTRGVKLLDELARVRASNAQVAESTKPAPQPARTHFETLDEPIHVSDAPRIERKVEKKIEKKPAPKPTEESIEKRSIIEMQRVYAHAEKLLKEGMEIGRVTIETALPEEELKLLSQMIEIERSEEEVQVPSAQTERDPRLGVLGGMKRQVQTV